MKKETLQKRTKIANVDMKTINTDAFLFVDTIRKSYGNFSEKIFIGGLTGCKGDAYKPEEALSENDSYHFHKMQMQILAEAGVDFLFASTLPALTEAIGIAKAMSETEKDCYCIYPSWCNCGRRRVILVSHDAFSRAAARFLSANS